MQSMGVWSLNHDLTATLRPGPKIYLHLHKCNSVRVDPYAHPQLIKVLKIYTYDMDVKCNLWGFGPSTMTLQNCPGPGPT